MHIYAYVLAEINYGEFVARCAFKHALRARAEKDRARLLGCDHQTLAKEADKFIDSIQELTRDVFDRMAKFAVIVKAGGQTKSQAACEKADTLKEHAPRWVLAGLYKSPFPQEDWKIKFYVEPARVGEEVERFIRQTDLKSYTITCQSETCIKDVVELTKGELSKLSSRIKDVAIGFEGKVRPQKIRKDRCCTHKRRCVWCSESRGTT